MGDFLPPVGVEVRRPEVDFLEVRAPLVAADVAVANGLPLDSAAVRLAMEQVILPEINHLVREARR